MPPSLHPGIHTPSTLFPFVWLPVPFQGPTRTRGFNPLSFPETLWPFFLLHCTLNSTKASFLFLLFFLWHLLGVPVLLSPKLPGMSFLGLHLFHLSMSEMREMVGGGQWFKEGSVAYVYTTQLPLHLAKYWSICTASLLQHEHPFHPLFDREVCAFKELQGNMGNHFLVYILEKMKARKALKWSWFSSRCIVITQELVELLLGDPDKPTTHKSMTVGMEAARLRARRCHLPRSSAWVK